MKKKWYESWHDLTRIYRAQLATPHFESAIEQLHAWYNTKQGQHTLNIQTQWVNEQVSSLFGYHLMQMGVMPHPEFCSSSRIHHRFCITPPKISSHTQRNGSILHASSTHLPFADDSIDVLVMHHALDFSHHPHHVLNEAARVTVPNGHIIIMGFNPYSLWGLKQLTKRLYSQNPIYKPQHLRAGRIIDWLALLNFTELQTHYASIGWLGQKRSDLSHMLKPHVPFAACRGAHTPSKMKSFALPIGGMYFIVARKDKACMTRLKPAWKKTRFLGVHAIPQKNVGATAKEHYADILPLRLPYRK